MKKEIANGSIGHFMQTTTTKTIGHVKPEVPLKASSVSRQTFGKMGKRLTVAVVECLTCTPSQFSNL